MGLFDKFRGGSVQVEDETAEAKPVAEPACKHPNRQDVRTFGRGGSSANRWRCTNCGYSPIAELSAK